ncbi:unnamed protein product [Trichobilharzia regenti]|nr:unnamed protein product [Trichobilharzia regenti]
MVTLLLAARSLPFFSNTLSYRATSALSTKFKSLYSVFELRKDATHQEIKEAFYRLSKLYHPDVTDDPNARGKFHELMRAYEVLGNPIKRNEYDRGLVHPRSDRIDTDFEQYSIDSIRDSSKDNFKSFYVKQHNRILNESWERQSDRELIMTVVSFIHQISSELYKLNKFFRITCKLELTDLKVSEYPCVTVEQSVI